MKLDWNKIIRGLNKTEWAKSDPLDHYYGAWRPHIPHKVPDIQDDEDGWDRLCFPPNDRDECLERQAELFVMLADLLIQQHQLGCGLGPLIDGYDADLDCGSQSEECQSVCNEIQNLLECIDTFIDVGCPEAPETEGCCCWCLYCDLPTDYQMKILEEWMEKEGGITEEDWQWFFDGTFCVHTGEDFCNSDGGEFHPGEDEEECDSFACPPNCP